MSIQRMHLRYKIISGTTCNAKDKTKTQIIRSTGIATIISEEQNMYNTLFWKLERLTRTLYNYIFVIYARRFKKSSDQIDLEFLCKIVVVQTDFY